VQKLRAVLVVAVCPAAEVALLSNHRVLQGVLLQIPPCWDRCPLLFKTWRLCLQTPLLS